MALIWPWAAVAIGGALGSLARHALATLSSVWLGHPHAGTTAANVLGSAAIAVAMVCFGHEKFAPVPVPVQLFVRVGLLGGLTTFSSFIAESVTLYAQPGPRWIVYVAANLLLGTAAFLVATILTRHWMGG